MSCAARLDFVQSGFFAFFKTFFQVTTQKFGNRGNAHRSSDERGKQITRLFADAKGGENVKPYSHEEHKRHAFDSFCKKVLRNEARDYYDEMKRQRDREVSFSELSAQEMDMLFLMDKYPSEQFNFSVLGHAVAIESELIAQAIAALPDEKRDIILLAYFLDMTDGEIGATLNLVRSTVQYKRTSSLQELKKIMEGNANE